MSLKFDGTLIGAADIGDWDSETDAGAVGTIVNTAPLKGSEYYYSVAHTASNVAYFVEDITGDGFESHWGKWRVRLAEYTAGASDNKLIFMNRVYNGANERFSIGLQSVTGGRLEEVVYKYRTSADALTTALSDFSANLTLVDGNIYEFEYQYRPATSSGNDGILKVWITDIDGAQGKVLVVDETTIDLHPTNTFTELRNGVTTNFTDTYTIDIGSAQYSTNGNFTDEAETYWIDETSGAETNAGTESASFKYTLQANNSAKAGDTIKLSSRTATTPHRLIDMEQIDVIATGGVNNVITVDGNDQWLTATKDYSDATWVDSGVNDEWYVDVSDTGDYDPNRIYVCTRAAWNSIGMAAMDKDSIRDAGTKGSLTAGTYDYDSGNERVYYKAASGETLNATMSTLHIEIPSRLAANDDVILLDTSYQHIKDMTIFGAIGTSVIDTTTSKGSFIENVTSTESWSNGIHLTDSTAYKCTATWTRGTGNTGIHCSSAGDVIACETHNNNNDGISFNNGTGIATGNVSYHNGYEASGNQCGIEMTGAANAVSAMHNTCVGNHTNGILWNQGDITAVTIKDNICAFNGTYGFNGANDSQNTEAEVTTAFTYNASHGNGSQAFHYAGAGATEVSPANTVIADPLFTDASTNSTFDALDSKRIGEDYTIQSGSPCTDTTDGGTIVQNSWLAANEAPPELQMGCAKAKRGSMGAYR